MNYKLLIALALVCQCTYAQTRTTQVYNTYAQGVNYHGGAYVPPVVTKTYVTYNSPSSSNSNSSRSSTTASSYSSSSSAIGTTSGAGKYLYRSAWERKYEKQQRKALLEAKQQVLAAISWKTQADLVMAHYNNGNMVEAERIRRTISMFPPSGVGDIVKMETPNTTGYNPASLSGGPFEQSYKRKYHYTCILLFAELKNYTEAIGFYNVSFSDSKQIGNNFAANSYSHTYYHEQQTPSLIEAFKNYNYPAILKLESAFVEALKHQKGVQEARLRWKAITDFYLPVIEKIKTEDEKSLCYNILAMVQLELGLTEDAVRYFQKQLDLSAKDVDLQFSIYQNLVEFILSTPQKNEQLTKYCIGGFEKLLPQATEAKAGAELIYSIKYNLANLLLNAGDLEKAEKITESQQNISGPHMFAHKMLLANILTKEIEHLRKMAAIPTELEKIDKEYNNYTPEKKREFDSLFAAGHFSKEPNYTYESQVKQGVLLDILGELIGMRNSLNTAEKIELDIFNAEHFLTNLSDYEGAILTYTILISNTDNNWPYELRIAQIYALQQKYKEAIGVLAKSISENTEEYQLYIALAEVYQKTGKAKKAKENYLLAQNKGAFLPEDALTFINNK